MKYTINNHVHEYENAQVGPTCKHCGLLKATIEAAGIMAKPVKEHIHNNALGVFPEHCEACINKKHSAFPVVSGDSNQGTEFSAPSKVSNPPPLDQDAVQDGVQDCTCGTASSLTSNTLLTINDDCPLHGVKVDRESIEGRLESGVIQATEKPVPSGDMGWEDRVVDEFNEIIDNPDNGYYDTTPLIALIKQLLTEERSKENHFSDDTNMVKGWEERFDKYWPDPLHSEISTPRGTSHELTDMRLGIKAFIRQERHSQLLHIREKINNVPRIRGENPGGTYCMAFDEKDVLSALEEES